MKKTLLAALACTLPLSLSAFAQSADAPVISPALEAQMDELVGITESIRELNIDQPVERAFPSRDEVRAFVNQAFSESLPPEELARYTAFYVALGLLPADTDLLAIYGDLLGAQVAGYYDPETRLMNVVPVGDGIGETLTITEQITFVHEYVHALQDAVFGLEQFTDNEGLSPDEALARLSLIEGDATLVMNLFTEQAAVEDPGIIFQLLLEGAAAGTLTLPPGIPEVLVNELLFPYNQGMILAQTIVSDGGWSALDAAFANPPSTSEQVIHPERFLAGEGPIAIDDAPDFAAVLGEDWTTLWDDRLGQYYLREHLNLHLGMRTADEAASGWGNDVFYVGRNSRDVLAVGVFQVWDTAADADEFMSAYAEWLTAYAGDVEPTAPNGDDATLCAAAAGGASAACVRQLSTTETVFAHAPTLEEAQALIGEAAPTA